MALDLPADPKYQDTMARLERLRRVSGSGAEYWLAREIQTVLGYSEWRNFIKAVKRSRASLEANGIEPSHHIVETTRMMEVGKGAMRQNRDFFLTRGACYLIAMNGHPDKPEIAAAQSYFAVQTRAREVENISAEDEKRLELREKVKESFKEVSGVAKQAGVRNEKQPIFHDARYRGLYKMSSREMKEFKGINPKDSPLDHMGALELSANDFQMNLAAETIRKEGVRGQESAIRKNKEVGERVRQTMVDSGSRPPEKLPPAEPIKNVAKRLKSKKKLPEGPST